MISFNRYYFSATIMLFLVEVFIALFMRDHLIRPYGGDFLVVIFLYCFVNTFWKGPHLSIAILVLLFAYAIEITQYFHLAKLLHLQDSRFALLLIGKSFQWLDMVAYTLGILLTILIEATRLRLKNNSRDYRKKI